MNEKNNAVNQAGRHTSAPSPAAGFEVLLITGMSGAGRSTRPTASRTWAGMVVDNMPPKLLVPLVDMIDQLRFEHPQTRRGHRREVT